MDISQLEPLVRLLGPFSATIVVAVWWITQAIQKRRNNANPGIQHHQLEDISLKLDKLITQLDALSALTQKGVSRTEDIWQHLPPGGATP